MGPVIHPAFPVQKTGAHPHVPLYLYVNYSGYLGRGHTLNQLTNQASSRLQGMTPTFNVSLGSHLTARWQDDFVYDMNNSIRSKQIGQDDVGVVDHYAVIGRKSCVRAIAHFDLPAMTSAAAT